MPPTGGARYVRMSEAGALLRHANIGGGSSQAAPCQPRIAPTVGARHVRMSEAGGAAEAGQNKE